MCLILLAQNDHPEYKTILAANRDEFFNRPTLPANYWNENKNVLGGKDLQSGGTWLGVTRNGRFIAITNYRDLKNINNNALSRGELSKKFLMSDQAVDDFLAEISQSRNKYNGFNLLLSADSFNTMYHYSNTNDRISRIPDGIHGLSNELLDTSWPKVDSGKKQLADIISSRQIDEKLVIEMLQNDKEAADHMLPDTGISRDLEKKLSPVFISMKGYGTRCSTLILVERSNRITFLEITYNEKKEKINEKRFIYQLP